MHGIEIFGPGITWKKPELRDVGFFSSVNNKTTEVKLDDENVTKRIDKNCIAAITMNLW